MHLATGKVYFLSATYVECIIRIWYINRVVFVIVFQLSLLRVIFGVGGVIVQKNQRNRRLRKCETILTCIYSDVQTALQSQGLIRLFFRFVHLSWTFLISSIVSYIYNCAVLIIIFVRFDPEPPGFLNRSRPNRMAWSTLSFLSPVNLTVVFSNNKRTKTK